MIRLLWCFASLFDVKQSIALSDDEDDDAGNDGFEEDPRNSTSFGMQVCSA